MAKHRYLYLLVLSLSIATTVRAGIVRIVITSVESPTFGGHLFGETGAYEKLRGIAYGEVDPRLPQNALIADIQLAPRNKRGMVLTITVPTARNPDGSSITGASYEYISFDNNTTTSYRLSYPAVGGATLTVKDHLDDSARALSANSWEYADSLTIRLLPRGTAFKQSAIYEFRYTARDPLVAGLGLAATRDFVSFLRYEKADALGQRNPLAGRIRWTFSFAVSQPARYVNDFQTLGFNCDEWGRRVFDGIENWLGGGSGVGINYRFAQPDRTERNRQNHLYPEAVFPFAYPELTDPYSGRKGGRLVRCAATNTCPFVFNVNSSNEYWVKAASLLHSNLQGKDLPDPPKVRFYLIAGTQHGTGNSSRKGSCQLYQNPNNAEPALRALWVDLDDWVTKSIAPPPSKVPRHADGTAADAVPRPGSLTGVVPQAVLGWPNMAGVEYTGLITTRFYFDYGPQFDKVYPCFVSKVDKDGNEVAGIRLPPVAVPIATYTGWALRAAPFGGPDGCEGAGQYIPFARSVVEKRYGTQDGYVQAVRQAVEKLVRTRFLLEEDAAKYIRDALLPLASWKME